jgi:hypothetical protein
MATTPNQPRTPLRLSEDTAPFVLLVGSLLGMALLVIGLILTVRAWGIVVGGIEEWHKNWWRLLLCELAIFGGLAVMFVALQMARSEERTNPSMRRLLYGYNAVLTCLLLVTILGHLNVLAYLPLRPFNYVNATYDWTEATLYTLSPESKAFLEKLDQPVKVYVMIPAGDDFLHREVDTLMDNCRRVTNKIEVEELSPDQSPAAVARLIEKYQLPERQGVLLVYGPEGNEKYEFIKEDELFTVKRAGPGNPDEKPRVQFTGESALIGKLSFLVQGKERSVIYFTQGNGELDLDNSFESNRDDVGLGRLRERLGRANYEVKGLKLGFAENKVPDDAEIVVIARPTNRLPEPALNALREYMKPADPKKKKGKLVVLFDVVKGPDGTMVQTGLEGFLNKEFGVQVGNNRIGCLSTPSKLDVIVTAAPRTENPIATPYQGRGIIWRDVRTVEQAQRGPQPPPTDFQVEQLLVASERYGIWKETNLNVDVAALARSLVQPDHDAELRQKLSPDPLPVAVTVSELGAPKDPGDPHAFMSRQQQPRLVVFGDATWVSNRRMGEAGELGLFSGTLAWLRDRPDVAVATQPKERKPYIIQTDTPRELFWRLLGVPVVVIAFCIAALGAGVWVVRRR